MTSRSSQLLEQALQLIAKDQAELAAAIIASVDGDPDADVEHAWAVELERRARKVLAGESTGTDWSTVRARIEAKLSSGE